MFVPASVLNSSSISCTSIRLSQIMLSNRMKFLNMRWPIFMLGSLLSFAYCDQPCEVPKCQQFVALEPSEPSIFVIHANGRLGNHLMAFAIVVTLAKTLNVRPYVQGETAKYLSQYFVAENIPTYEDTFCDSENIPSVMFDDDLDVLIEAKNLHTGHVVELWPWGYKENSPVCCPADDLMNYVSKNNLHEVRNALEFKPKYKSHAEKVQQQVAASYNATLEEITFVGIHNRRTDHMEYFYEKFSKKPLKKGYFRQAMDHFREECETEKIAFLFVSDDMEWGKQELKGIQKKHKDLFFVGVGKEEPDAIGYDMAVMASCDHTIMSRGSFSSWCAILSGGEYYGEYGLIVPLRELISQQDKELKKKKKKAKKKKRLL